MSPLTIAAGIWDCTVLAELGGAILSLRRDGRHMLRPAPDRPTDILETGCFALLPFANRIGGGILRFTGRDHRLTPDPAALPHAHHGHGWRRPWTVADRCPDALSMTLMHEGEGGWPWHYRAAQTLRLDAGGLSIALEIANLSDEAMPAGAGIHPYFIRSADSAVAGRAISRWENDATGLASQLVPGHPFAGGAVVPVAALEGIDNFFHGDADVTVLQDDGAIRLGCDRGAGFHIYAPADRDFFCVEPVSHPPDSFGRGDYADDDILPPGAVRTWRFRIEWNDAPDAGG